MAAWAARWKSLSAPPFSVQLLIFLAVRIFGIASQLLVRLHHHLSGDDLGGLRADLADQLRFLQAVELLLLIEDRAQAVGGVFGVAAQGFQVLLLFVLVADLDRAFADRGVGGGFGVAAAVAAAQHAAGALAHQRAFQRAGEAAAGAEAEALAFHLEVRLVVLIAEAQRAGIQRVFVGLGGAGDHRAVQLGMAAHLDVEAALAGVEAGLLLHADKVAVRLLAAAADGGAAVHAAESEAGAG